MPFSFDQEQLARQLRELGERAKVEGRLIEVEELLETIGIAADSGEGDTADDGPGEPAAATFSEAPKIACRL